MALSLVIQSETNDNRALFVEEVIDRVFNFLDTGDLVIARQVCKLWNQQVLVNKYEESYISQGFVPPMTLQLNAKSQQDKQMMISQNCTRRLAIKSKGKVTKKQVLINRAFLHTFSHFYGKNARFLYYLEKTNVYPSLHSTLSLGLFPNLTSLIVDINPGQAEVFAPLQEKLLSNLKILKFSNDSKDVMTLSFNNFNQTLLDSAPNIENLMVQTTSVELGHLLKLKSLHIIYKNQANSFDAVELKNVLNQVRASLKKLVIYHECKIEKETLGPLNLPKMANLIFLSVSGCIATQLSKDMTNFSATNLPRLQNLNLANRPDVKKPVDSCPSLHLLNILEAVKTNSVPLQQLSNVYMQLFGVPYSLLLDNLVSQAFPHLKRLVLEIWHSDWSNINQFQIWDDLWSVVAPLCLTHLTILIPAQFNYPSFLNAFDEQIPQLTNGMKELYICNTNKKTTLSTLLINEFDESRVQRTFLKLKGMQGCVLYLKDWKIPAESVENINKLIQQENLQITFV